jgi:hypothetical protein
MKIEIQAENDDNFSIVNELQTDVASETVASETVASETVENAPGVISKAPRSAPIENNQGPGWFSGTSWG